MKRSLRHLPEQKQNELHKIASYITEARPVHMVILFGSFARGNWVEDKYLENGTTYEYKSDYDLLVVVDDEVKANLHKPAKRLKQKIRRNVELETPVNIIYHGINYLNAEIEDGNYFFTDILKEGIRLYHSKKYVLAKPKQLSNKDRVRKAQMYFDKWFESANDFLFQYEFAFESNKYSIAVFLLHQAAERFYMTTLLVFNDYKPKIHDLEELNTLVCKLDAKFKTVFPRRTQEEDRLFFILKKAYIDSRYKLNYEVSKEDLEYLSKQVKHLQHLTENICLARIEYLKKKS